MLSMSPFWRLKQIMMVDGQRHVNCKLALRMVTKKNNLITVCCNSDCELTSSPLKAEALPCAQVTVHCSVQKQDHHPVCNK